MIYLCVSRRYHYHHQNEVVNEQDLGDEIYEKELDMVKEYERQKKVAVTKRFAVATR